MYFQGIHLDPSIYLMDEESNGKTSHADIPTARETEKVISSTKQGQNINAEVTTNIESTRFSEENIKAEIVGGSRGISSSVDSCQEPHYASIINSSSFGIIQFYLLCFWKSLFSANYHSLATHKREVIILNQLKVNAVKGQSPNFTNAVNDQSPEKAAKKASTKAIIIPIVLKMDEFDHKVLHHTYS